MSHVESASTSSGSGSLLDFDTEGFVPKVSLLDDSSGS